MELAGHGAVLLSQLNAQREFGFLCDCTVVIGDVLFKAHKAVLAAFSNYFRTLFIHQDSDCVRLKPEDIQPEIFSFLLNLMYTGRLSPQVIDPLHLEQGVKFLHAYPLLQGVGQVVPTAVSHPELSVPLATFPCGIQISDQPSWVLSWRQASTLVKADHQSGTKGMAGEPGLVNSNFEGTAFTCADPAAAEVQGLAVPAAPYAKISMMRKRGSAHRQYPCSLCGSRFAHRSSLREHLLLHTQALLPGMGALEAGTPAASPGGSAPSPARTSLTPSSQDEEAPRRSSVVVVSTRQQLPNTDSSVEQTLSPSDTADVENPEGADPGREVPRRRYECSTCGRKFIQKSHWREHMYIHTGKPYRCSACGKSFCRANQVARHTCPSQSAELYASDDGSQMEAPYPTAGRPYKCNMCESTLSSPQEILRHPCFTQNALVLSNWINQRVLSGEELSKDDGSDCSNAEPFITTIKTEEIVAE